MPRRIDPIEDDTDYFIQANTSAEDVVALHQPKSLLIRSFRRQCTSATAELSTCTNDNNTEEEEDTIVVQVAPLVDDKQPLSSPEQTLEQHNNNKSTAGRKGRQRPVTRRHSMSDISAPSRWSLALERYQKEVPTKEGPPSSPVRRRCTTNDIKDSDWSDFDGLTPKLYSEVERLSTSCHTLLTSCSTESPALDDSKPHSRRGSKTSTDETAPTPEVDGGDGDRKPRRSKPVLSHSIRSKSATSLPKATTSSSTHLKKKVCPTSTLEVAESYYKPSSSSSKKKKKSSLDKKIEKKKKELLKLEKQKSMKSLPNINLDTKPNSKKKKRQRPVMVRSVSVNHALRLSQRAQRDDESVSSLELSLHSSTSSLEVGELFDLLMSIED